MVLPHGTPPPPSPRGGSGGGGVASWCGVRSSCGCDAVGGLGLLVRCRRGSGGCGCAAAGGLGVLVRCRRWSGVAGALPQGAWGCWCAAAGGRGVVSERASTGRLTAAVGWALGLRPGWDARFFVRALEGQGSAFATGSRRERRSVRASAHEGRIVGALGGGVGSAHADSCVLRERRPENPSRRRSQPPGRGPFGAQDESKPRRRSRRSSEKPRECCSSTPHPSAQYSSTLEVGPETISSSPVVTKVSAWA